MGLNETITIGPSYCCFCGRELYHWSFLHCASDNCDGEPLTPEAVQRVENTNNRMVAYVRA